MFGQTLVNKEWAVANAHPMGLDWHSSTLDLGNQLITVGNTVVPNQGANMLVQKFDTEGGIEWQQVYQSAGTNNDYGTAVITDSDKNVYVCGTTQTNSQYDILVVKYNAQGTQLWVAQYNSSFSRNDIATTLKTDATGNLYVCGTSEGATTLSDFLLLKFNSTGQLQWQKRYDYANLIEIPAALEFDNVGNIIVVGASATNFMNWDYTLVRYNTEGMLQNVVRQSVAGVGFDQPVAARKDALGNLYVVGKAATDGVNYDIKTVKFNVDLSVSWIRTYDGRGFEDAAADLAIDDEGHILVAGYSTKDNGLKELTLIKYDTDGNRNWLYKQEAYQDGKSSIGKALDVNDKGRCLSFS